MILANHFWSENGVLDNATNLLVLLSVLAFLVIAVPISFVWNLIKIKKAESIKKYYNKTVIGLFISNYVLALCFAIIGFISLMGENTIGNADMAFTLMISSLVISFLSVTISFGSIVLFEQYVAIAITDEAIIFLDEFIKYSKIVNIMEDESKKAIYINYNIGKRKLKKLKLSKNLVGGQFLISNINLMNQEIIKGNEMDFFRTYNQEQKIAIAKELESKQASISAKTKENKKDSDKNKD